MVRAAVRAARTLSRDFGEVEQLQWSMKGPADFVSAADRRAEQILVEDLHKARPDFSILSEEGGLREGRFPEHRFIVDPLEGTTNFLHAMPHFRLDRPGAQGEVMAASSTTVSDELFWAEKGNGAYMNDTRIRVSRTQAMDRALVACGLPVRDWKGRKSFPRQYEAVADKVMGLRRMGVASLDLAYVACGRLDGYWEYGIQPWDYELDSCWCARPVGGPDAWKAMTSSGTRARYSLRTPHSATNSRRPSPGRECCFCRALAGLIAGRMQ